MSALLGNSYAVAREPIREGAGPARVGPIYNGVDLQAFRSLPDQRTAREALSIAQGTLVFVKVANFRDCSGARIPRGRLGRSCHRRGVTRRHELAYRARNRASLLSLERCINEHEALYLGLLSGNALPEAFRANPNRLRALQHNL